MLDPKPQRTMLISSITARGLTLTTSCMNVPLSSENGPNDIAGEHPITSVKKAVAAFTSGTVMPVWSWPRRPGISSADEKCGDTPIARVTQAASRNLDVVVVIMVAPLGSISRCSNLSELAAQPGDAS